ncbi:unnamed protein product [Gongylonema pulchrum]|uniref:Transmembrane protein n=1 Tax=Gongylonema pulchrum TaxID=637853 RepID=A0A183DDG7_9BILA|nr:unnamed protein product [Gongylonema pulchrum]
MPPEVDATGSWFYEPWVLKFDALDALGLSNRSVIDSLGLFSWYTPASWYRIALEFVHNYFDLPWVTSIICSK